MLKSFSLNYFTGCRSRQHRWTQADWTATVAFWSAPRWLENRCYKHTTKPSLLSTHREGDGAEIQVMFHECWLMMWEMEAEVKGNLTDALFLLFHQLVDKGETDLESSSVALCEGLEPEEAFSGEEQVTQTEQESHKPASPPLQDQEKVAGSAETDGVESSVKTASPQDAEETTETAESTAPDGGDTAEEEPITSQEPQIPPPEEDAVQQKVQSWRPDRRPVILFHTW